MFKRIITAALLVMLSTPSFAGIYDKWKAYVPETLAGLGQRGFVSGVDTPPNNAGLEMSGLTQQYQEDESQGSQRNLVTLEFSYTGSGLWQEELDGFKSIAGSLPGIEIIEIKNFPAVLERPTESGGANRLMIYLSAYTKVIISAANFDRAPDMTKLAMPRDLKGIKASAK